MNTIQKMTKNDYQFPISKGVFLDSLEEVDVTVMVTSHCLRNKPELGS